MRQTISIETKKIPVILIPDVIYSNAFIFHKTVSRGLKMHFVRPSETDLHNEGKTKLPTILWIIGGAWKQTAPVKFAAEFKEFAEQGYNVAMIDYRTSNEAEFPGAVQDVKTAVRFLKFHADTYGVDENRIAVMGNSAGGYLAAMLGTTAGVKEFETREWKGADSSVKAVIDIFGASDIGELLKVRESGAGIAGQPEKCFLGEKVLQDPEKMKWANPLHFISQRTAPFLILHGTADCVVPCSQSGLLYDALEKCGVPAELYFVEGAPHAGYEFWQPEVKKIMLDFLKKYL